MNILLFLGLLLIVGYSFGWLLKKMGLPKIIGYIATGIIFSPNTLPIVDHGIIEITEPLMKVCLAFIAFEVGGALIWKKLKKHRKEIVNITLMASIIPFILVAGGMMAIALFFPAFLPYSSISVLALSLIFGALASPTDPAATFAVIHQYKAKGKVTDTIVGVAVLDDAIGILLFSLIIGGLSIYMGSNEGFMANPFLNTLYQIGTSIAIGAGIGFCFSFIHRIFKFKNEGQWVVIVFALIIFCTGISELLKIDEILCSMAMGIVVANSCKEHKTIFRILERYTEDLVFLVFFLLSGLYLDIASIPHAALLMIAFVLLRAAGKIYGAKAGSMIAKADPQIRKYSFGGLIAQGGIVIGLCLSVYNNEQFHEIAEILLVTIMGATVIHELLGPLATKYSLKKAGEISVNQE